jgi:hypothetical protein
MTGEEYDILGARCRELGITLAANQNCFGHLAAWLTHDRYLPLAEIDRVDRVWKFLEWDRAGPFSLCPIDPRSVDLVRDMLDQLLPHFPSRLVNINCDETFDVGQGRSREAVERLGAATVYYDFVHRIVDEVRRRGFRAMFWADIALSYPDQIGMMPNDLLALAWGYEPDSDFERWGHTLKHAGREFWVCPGTSSWRSITGRTSERRGNLDAAVRAARKHGAGGLLMTDWGDLGHRQQWPVSLHGIADGLSAAWTGEPAGPDLQAESLQVFGDGSLTAGAWLEDAGDLDRSLRLNTGKPDESGGPTRLKNASALFQDSTLHFRDPWKPGDSGQWMASREAADWLGGRVPASMSELLKEEFAFTALAAKTLLGRAVARRAADRAGLGALRDGLQVVREQHERLWLRRSRPGGLRKSTAHYDRLLDEQERE